MKTAHGLGVFGYAVDMVAKYCINKFAQGDMHTEYHTTVKSFSSNEDWWEVHVASTLKPSAIFIVTFNNKNDTVTMRHYEPTGNVVVKGWA